MIINRAIKLRIEQPPIYKELNHNYVFKITNKL